MNKIYLLVLVLFGLMVIGFIGQLIRAWILEIRYRMEKRKALKKKTSDNWTYEI